MLKMNPAELLKMLVATPSVSGDEARIAAEVLDWARTRGLSAEMAGRNVVIRIGRAGGKRLLLNSHLDTVAPQASWKGDPFVPVEKDGRIYGLGANDAKGCVAALLMAATGCRDENISGEAIFALTVEEETGPSGRGLDALVGELGKIDAAVIGEPTGLAICRAQKGLLLLDVETKGDARHAAHAHRIDGKNAVVEAARAVLYLDGWLPGPSHPLLGPATCQVTMIEGGKSRNVIPDRCTFCLDLRTVPGVTTDEIIRSIREKTNARVTIRSDRMKPFETEEGSVIVQAALRARHGAALIGSATMSDAVWTRHLPTIKVGPGETERSHTPGEYIGMDELSDGVEFYKRLIREYLSQ